VSKSRNSRKKMKRSSRRGDGCRGEISAMVEPISDSENLTFPGEVFLGDGGWIGWTEDSMVSSLGESSSIGVDSRTASGSKTSGPLG